MVELEKLLPVVQFHNTTALSVLFPVPGTVIVGLCSNAVLAIYYPRNLISSFISSNVILSSANLSSRTDLGVVGFFCVLISNV